MIVGQHLAIEIKPTKMIQSKHLKGIKALREEQLIQHYAVVSHDPTQRIVDGITIYPWKLFLEKLWGNNLL